MKINYLKTSVKKQQKATQNEIPTQPPRSRLQCSNPCPPEGAFTKCQPRQESFPKTLQAGSRSTPCQYRWNRIGSSAPQLQRLSPSRLCSGASFWEVPSPPKPYPRYIYKVIGSRSGLSGTDLAYLPAQTLPV